MSRKPARRRTTKEAGRIRQARRNTMAIYDDMTRGLTSSPVTGVGEQSTFKARLKNTRHRRALLALAAMLAVSLGATPRTGAQALACKPNVRVVNLRGVGTAAIKVLSFKYKVGDNTVYTEPLANKILTPYQTENWPSQTLNHAPNGTVITSSAVELQIDNGPGWGPSFTSAWFPHTFGCGARHNYIHEIR
jgi:hypothetical protein